MMHVIQCQTIDYRKKTTPISLLVFILISSNPNGIYFYDDIMYQNQIILICLIVDTLQFVWRITLIASFCQRICAFQGFRFRFIQHTADLHFGWNRKSRLVLSMSGYHLFHWGLWKRGASGCAICVYFQETTSLRYTLNAITTFWIDISLLRILKPLGDTTTVHSMIVDIGWTLYKVSFYIWYQIFVTLYFDGE